MASRNGRLAGALILIALSCTTTVSAQTSTLYARLGGTPVVTAFVADTIDKLVAHPKKSHAFDGANLQRVKDLLTQRICSLTGGGCTAGASFREVHAGHQISATDFSILVEVLRESMRARDVPLAARKQLLEILAPMNGEVVTL